MVKRLHLHGIDDFGYETPAFRCVDDYGDYVEYEEYKKLEQRIAELEKIEAAAIEFVRDSYRPTAKYDAMRFDKLAALLPGGE